MTAPRKSIAKIKDSTVYYNHQIEGVRMMARIGSFILADEMGLGKSLQALTVAAVDFERDRAQRVLVVSPATLKWNWLDEVRTHTNFSALVLDGTPTEREAQLATFVEQGWDILIVNYEQVVKHIDALNSIHFDIGVYDEAHYMKSHRSGRTKACHALNPPRNFLLTGSPMLNQVNELWGLLHRCNPSEFPSYWRFHNRYCVMGGYKDKQIVGVKNKGELQSILDRYMIRRTKAQVLTSLPEKLPPTVVVVDLHPEQKKLYDQIKDEMKMDVPDLAKPIDIENHLTKFLRLKQVCGTTATIDGYDDHSYKLDRVMEMVKEITDNGEHVVIFTQFRGVLAAVNARLDKAKIPTFTLHGDVPIATRSEIVKTWGDHRTPAAMVAMLQVAGVGLNMTQASKCIFVDKLFVPKLNEQAEDRLHRIGQRADVQPFHMICRKTIEYRIEAILRKKHKLFTDLVNDSDWKKALLKALLEEEETDE